MYAIQESIHSAQSRYRISSIDWARKLSVHHALVWDLHSNAAPPRTPSNATPTLIPSPAISLVRATAPPVRDVGLGSPDDALLPVIEAEDVVDGGVALGKESEGDADVERVAE